LGKITFYVVVVQFLLPGFDFFRRGSQRAVLVERARQSIPAVPAGAAADRDITKFPGSLDGNLDDRGISELLAARNAFMEAKVPAPDSAAPSG